MPEAKTVETLVEIITREVLVAMLEEKERKQTHADGQCKFTCGEGLCLRTCYDRAGQVVSAGADRLVSTIGVIPQDQNLAHLIDHTLLKPDATPDQIAQLCFEARKHGFASVCINPAWVELCGKAAAGLTGQSLHGDRFSAGSHRSRSKSV